MRKVLLIFAFIVVLLLAEQAPHNITALAQTNRGLTVGTTDTVETSLDPANAYDYFAWEITRSLGSGLVDYRPGATGPNDIIPDLATNWSVSSDDLQWTFSLRQEVKYDDETEFNASDVKYTFDREIGMADPDGPFVGIGFNDIIQDVTVVDAYTVRFDLKIPFGPFLSLIAGAECVMVDPKQALMHGTSWNYTTDVVLYTEGNPRASNPIGLGPYTLGSWTRIAGRDSQITLVANPNYWNASSEIPKTKNIIIQFYADSTDLALAITAGNVDIAFRQLGTQDISNMENNSNLTVWQGPGAFIQYLCLQEKYWPFNETSIRQAVGAAIDRTALVNTVFQGQAQNLYSLIPNGLLDHKDSFQSLGDANYTLTRELLAPYGYNETNKLTFTLWYETSGHYPLSAQQAQVLKASMEASGVITVNLNGLDWPSYGISRRIETMQAFILGWYPDYMDTDDYTFPFLDSSGSSWLHINYADPQMDQLVSWARGNASSSLRTALYSQIQDLMVTDSPIIPLYQGLDFVVSRKEITGIYLDITQEFRYQLIPFENIALGGTVLKTVVGQGYGLNVSVTVTNQGSSARTFNITVYCNSTAIGVSTNVTLLGGDSTTVVFVWNTSGFVYGNYTIWANVPPFPEETYTTDNNFTCPNPVHVGVPGDVSGPIPGVYDGKCGMGDIAYLVLHFMGKPGVGDPKWLPNCDINNDNVINMRDIAIAVLNFERHE